MKDTLDLNAPFGFNYRVEALRTAQLGVRSFDDTIDNCALGVAGEAGEVVDEIKKYLHHGKDLDRLKLIKEMGDVYWYLEVLGAILNVTTREILEANIKKLRERYPDGFSQTKANATREL